MNGPVPVRTNFTRDTLDVDAKHCATCGKPVKVRASTPTRVDTTGRTFRWCKSCYFTKINGLGFGKRQRR